MFNYHFDVLLSAHNEEVNNLGTPAFTENITHLLTAPITFTSAAQGGFATCTLTLACDDVEAAKFLEEHLGRKISIANVESPYDGYEVWQGQIYTVTIDDGKRSIGRSMANVFNSVTVLYTEAIVIGGINYYEGESTQVGVTGNTTSQGKYGLRELKYSAGVMTDSAAEDYAYRLTYDYSNAHSVPGGSTVGGGGGGAVTVRLDCVGWFEQFNVNFYTNIGVSSTTISAQIIDVCNDWGNFDSSDQSNIASITTPIQEHQEEVISAADYIGRLCSIGGANNRRLYFGFYEGVKPYLFEEPTTTKYHVRRYDTSEIITDASTGLIVPPWLVRPGYICEFLDFVPSNRTYSTIKENPRAFIIGTVEFTAPNIVRLQPDAADPAALNMARMDYYSNYTLPNTLTRLEGLPEPWQDPVSTQPQPWWEIQYPIPLPGGTPGWTVDPLAPGYAGDRPWWLGPGGNAGYNGPNNPDLPHGTGNPTDPHP